MTKAKCGKETAVYVASWSWRLDTVAVHPLGLEMQCHLGGIEAKTERITYMRRRQAALLSPETAAADEDMIFAMKWMNESRFTCGFFSGA